MSQCRRVSVHWSQVATVLINQLSGQYFSKTRLVDICPGLGELLPAALQEKTIVWGFCVFFFCGFIGNVISNLCRVMATLGPRDFCSIGLPGVLPLI